jgi:tripartite-type tricarboxylate transporter receptor subunit TctC
MIADHHWTRRGTPLKALESFAARDTLRLSGHFEAKMKLSRRWLLSLGASAATLPIFSPIAGAQVYPSRPITIIVPVPPGGVADPVARILADHLTVTLGQPVVVENVTGVGPGGAGHVSAVYFQRATGTRFQFVPYRGGGPAIQDEVAGHVDLMFNEATGARPYVLSRQIKTYAVLAKSRWFAAPDIPTSEELGVPGINISFWHGLWVPKGTPKDIVVKLNAAVVAALADPTVRKRLTDIGQEIFPRDKQTPDALYAFHKEETEKWWPIIRGAGIKSE